jgi:hypothetical protein
MNTMQYRGYAAAIKANARSGQSMNKWAESVLMQAAHA